MKKMVYKSLRLLERSKIIYSFDNISPNETSYNNLQKWKNQKPFDTNPEWFYKRIFLDGINEEKLLKLISDPIPNFPPNNFNGAGEWINKISLIFNQYRTLSLSKKLINRLFESVPNSGFLNLIIPVLIYAQKEINRIVTQATHKLDCKLISQEIKDDLLIELALKLVLRLNRTLTLEINIARLENRLKGENSAQRFEYYCESLKTDEVFQSLLQEYPVLFRQILLITETRLNFFTQFFNHLTSDWEILWKTFFPNSPESFLTKLVLDGDSHRGGRSVILLHFASGLKLVYKPRNLNTDVHFYELINCLNQKGVKNPFRIIKTISQADHGWVEFVENGDCKSEEEVQHFYYRQGGYLAILYTLFATDFHFENLIASGEYPVLIDLESLFHPDIKNFSTENADQMAHKTLNESVLRVGMLPRRIWFSNPDQSMDVSAMGASTNQISAGALPILENVGSDEIKLTRQRLGFGTGVEKAQPKLNGKRINTLNYKEYLVNGFSDLYNILSSNKKDLLFANSPLIAFSNDEIRVIPRNTMTYQSLLLESYHPDALRDSIDRDRLFDRLWVSYDQYKKRADLILRAEQEELWRDDVPYFCTKPNSNALVCGEGTIVEDYFNGVGLDYVCQRLKSLSEEDLRWQIWIINASLASLVSMETIIYTSQYRNNLSKNWKRLPSNHPKKEISSIKSDLISEAQRIGDRLLETAIFGQDDVSWIDNTVVGEFITLAPTGLDLYSGLPGIALFLAHLGNCTQIKKYTLLAEKVVNTIQKLFNEKKDQALFFGVYGGLGGLLYLFIHLALLWQNNDYLNKAQEILIIISTQVGQKDQIHDVVGGYAGLISICLSYHELVGDEYSLNLAVRCGEKLISLAEPQASGCAWSIKINEKKNQLTGFSHGTAGVSWALLKLAEKTKRDDFKELAMQGIVYERSLFSKEAGNWPDLRGFQLSEQEEGSDHNLYFMNAWCHGAPGIGLARLDTLEIGDALFEQEVEVAIKKTRTDIFENYNHSLCHGDLGNLDFLLIASQKLQKESLHNITYIIAEKVLFDIRNNGWRTGIPTGVETFGLMTGISGIGYELLRLANPKNVPSILLLQLPTQNRKEIGNN